MLSLIDFKIHIRVGHTHIHIVIWYMFNILVIQLFAGVLSFSNVAKHKGLQVKTNLMIIIQNGNVKSLFDLNICNVVSFCK